MPLLKVTLVDVPEPLLTVSSSALPISNKPKVTEPAPVVEIFELVMVRLR